MSLYTRERARRSLFHTVVFRVISQSATIIGYVVMVRAMSERDFGVFHLLYTLIPLISSGASLGLEHVLRRFQPEYLSQSQIVSANWLVSFIGRVRFGTNLLVVALIFIGWHVITPLFDLQPYQQEFVFFSLLILLFFQFRILEISLSSHMLQKYSVGMQAAIAIVKIMGYASFALISDLSLENAILVDTLAYGLGYSTMYIIHRRLCVSSPPPMSCPLSRKERKRLLRYALFYNFNDAGTLTLNAKIDNFFIAAIFDPIAVGIYAFYSRLAEMSRHILPVNMFLNVVRPVLFATPQDQSATRIPKYFTLLLNTSLIVQIPITAFTLSFHKEIVIFIFGGKFLSDSWLLPVVMLFTTANTIGPSVLLAAQYSEKAGIILMSKVFGVYNIIALLTLIPVLGVYGAAISSGSATILKNLFIWWHVRYIARWINWHHVLLAAIGYWGSFFAITLSIRMAAFPVLVTLVIGVLLWVMIALGFLRSSMLSDSDRKILGQVMRGRERKILERLGLAY